MKQPHPLLLPVVLVLVPLWKVGPADRVAREGSPRDSFEAASAEPGQVTAGASSA
jgi:hypothetical protein